ncbi:MAG: BspA family leucine-rich repeat surface protein, partial [Oscillospiraceae bacterium]|nr:BspA family leucine-rich repeat surface protein [Oscillospiraceae bacterium]
MSQRISSQTKNLQRIACVLLAAIMLIGLFPGGAFAANHTANTSSYQSIAPLNYTFNIMVGRVGPDNNNAAFAPWGWLNDEPSTGTVVVGAGNVQGMPTVGGNYAGFGPWQPYRDDIVKIVFSEPVTGHSNLSSLFQGLSYLTTIENIDYIDLSGTNWLSNFFRGATSLTTITGLEDWDVAGVQRFSSMFRYATSLTSLDLSKWNMGSAQRLDSMFRGTNLTEIIGLDDWNTSSVLWMSHMFRYTTGLTSLDLSNWVTDSVTTLESMFRGAGNLTELIGLDNWNTSNVTTMQDMFRDTIGLIRLDLSSWDTSNTTIFTNMFQNATSLQVLALGSDWLVTGNLNLPNPPNNATFTGTWQNVGAGTVNNPQGTTFYTSSALMTGANGASNTWVWARAPHTVTFQAGSNGTLTPAPPPHTVTIPAGRTLAEAGISIPTPIPDAGYQFAHWESSNNPGATITPAYLLNNYQVIQNTTFTAMFVPLTAIEVIFDLSGGFVGGLPTDVSHYVLPGDPITVDGVPVPTRSGFIFLGWREDHTGALLSRADVGALIVTAPRTFVAQWTLRGSDGSDGEPWPPEPLLLERQAYLIGTDNGLVRPNASITRAEVATILFRLISDTDRTAYWSQANPFPDVLLGHWFNNAVSTTTRMGLFQGRADGTFAPNQPITRAELATVLTRFMDATGHTAAGDIFNDISGHWANMYINAAGTFNWVQGPHGKGGAFYPDR